MRYLILILLTLTTLSADAQRSIRRSSRHYITQKTLPKSIAPLLQDVWNQYEPNNLLCPIDSTGKRCVVGCVATAMTQVMHYWQWPAVGRGTHTYTDSIGCKQTLTANFAEHTYDWSNMLNHYEEGKYTQQQADAISLLSLDCGISVNMRYGSVTSGAHSIYQPYALTNYFGYDRGVQQLYRDFYSLEEITTMLKKELVSGRPILISAYNLNGGHAFVIDGYDENDRFHCCWGNPNGEDNGYTFLQHMIPNQPQWFDPNSPENGFNLLQALTIGIMPENHPDARGIEQHNYAFQYISAVTDSIRTKAFYHRDDIRLTIHDMSNIGWNIHTDSVSLMLCKNGEPVRPIYTYKQQFLLEEIDSTTYTDTLSISIPHDIDNGTYTIVPMYRDNHPTEPHQHQWREARTCVGTPNYLIATVREDKVNLYSDTASTAYLTLEDVDFPDLIMNASAPDYSIKVRNHGCEMAGRIYIYLEDLDEGKSDNILLQAQGITIGPDEERTITCHLTPFWASHFGQYRLHILYESNLFADELFVLPLPEERIVTIDSPGIFVFS